MKFHFFTYFVNPDKSLFYDSGKSKKQIFLDALKEGRLQNFKAGRTRLGFVSLHQEGDLLYCRFGKLSSITRNLSPEEKFRRERKENWPDCVLFINTSDDPQTGQKIAVEYKSNIFIKPLYALRALADQINQTLYKNGLVLSINPVSSEQRFWDIVRNNQGHIKELKFTYTTPNLFNLENDLNDDLKDLRDKRNVIEAAMTLKNKDGNLKIEDNDPLIKESVEYISRGGGEYVIKARKKTITSKDNVKTKTVTTDIIFETDDAKTAIKLAKELFYDP